MKTAIILRGLPGSGKSTIAHMLTDNWPNEDECAICSTDSYFYDEDGKYQFDPSKLGEYHASNLQTFTTLCEAGMQLVICDNTNSQLWEYEAYHQVALDCGYQVHIVTVGDFDVERCVRRNTHGVPQAGIQRMRDRWEV